MNYYLFRIIDGADIEVMQHKLEQKGLTHSFIVEEDASGQIFIGGHAACPIEQEGALLVETKKAAVDWEEQWTLFAKDFKEGVAHIQLAEKTLLLKPGPGFGDLSHPTTYLMIEMMKKWVANTPVVDIGTGSGILALSALLLGAKSAVGIDIDPAAIEHARENAKLNHLQATFSRQLPARLPKNSLFLMNMIVPEQKLVDPSQYNQWASLWIVSGILDTQEEKYRQLMHSWGWQILERHSQSEWLGFVAS